MIKVIYSKKSGKCDIGRINDKGDIFKEASKMRYWTPVLMIKVIYSKKILEENAILDACINDKGDIFKEVRKMRYWTY